MPEAPLRVYGLDVSYFTGKLEAYLRYKEIPYERARLTPHLWDRVIPRQTGARQMPAVELPDGRWMTDTSPIIEWLETQVPEPPVIPHDPLQGFFSHLIEDYADEWLWRPALHYRWSYRNDAVLLSRRIAAGLMEPIPAPLWLKSFFVRQRQIRTYVRGDGITASTRAHVEGIYLGTLERLSAIFENRPFLLGERPTLADYGFCASVFRHFSLDPTPAAIMIDRAPAVYEWVARLWNARASRAHGALLEGVPRDWSPILADVGSGYLPYLDANARAWKEGRKRFDVRVQGIEYTGLPTSRYRTWCLEKLRERYRRLEQPASSAARAVLEEHGCWEPLWRLEDPASGYDTDRKAPFGRGIRAFGH